MAGSTTDYLVELDRDASDKDVLADTIEEIRDLLVRRGYDASIFETDHGYICRTDRPIDDKDTLGDIMSLDSVREFRRYRL